MFKACIKVVERLCLIFALNWPHLYWISYNNNKQSKTEGICGSKHCSKPSDITEGESILNFIIPISEYFHDQLIFIALLSYQGVY